MGVIFPPSSWGKDEEAIFLDPPVKPDNDGGGGFPVILRERHATEESLRATRRGCCPNGILRCAQDDVAKWA